GPARFLCLSHGRPAGIIEVNCGLPFLAAADITKLVEDPEAADDLAEQVSKLDRRVLEIAALSVACSLYRRLAQEVSHKPYEDLDERGRAILPHLQDFLLWERTRSSGEASEEDGWIESYPLFFTNTNRRWSFLTLRESIDAGQTLLFIAPGADVSVGVGNVALRGVAPAYVSRLFPDS